MYELRRYQTISGLIPFSNGVNTLEWPIASRLMAYVDRMKHGNRGHSKLLDLGVWELKIDVGPGYRVYYLLERNRVILLLCGGDKGTQSKDIQNARKFAEDYRRRK